MTKRMTSFEQEKRRQEALWLVNSAAEELHALGLYPARFRELAHSAVLSDGYARPERVAGLFLGTLERALASTLVKA